MTRDEVWGALGATPWTRGLDGLADCAQSRVGELASAELWRSVGLSAFDAHYAMAHHFAWCGAFALDCCHRAGLLLDRAWVIGSGFLLVPTSLPCVALTEVRRGHIAYFGRHQHHAIVIGHTGNEVVLVNGNGLGGRVTVSLTGIASPTAFFDPEGAS